MFFKTRAMPSIASTDEEAAAEGSVDALATSQEQNHTPLHIFETAPNSTHV